MAAQHDRGANTAMKEDGVKLDLTDTQVTDIRELFSLFDTMGSGRMETQHVGAVMRAYALSPTEADVAHYQGIVDPEETGHVTFEDFLILMDTAIKETPDAEKELRKALRILDPGRTGSIPMAELRKVLSRLGEQLSEEEWEEFILTAELQTRNRIDRDELITILLGVV